MGKNLIIGVVLIAVAFPIIASAEDKKKPDLGILVVDAQRGVLVSGVSTGSLAEAMKFAEGDKFIRINDKPVTSIKDLRQLLNLEPGEYKIELRDRDNNPKPITGKILVSAKDQGKHFFLPKKEPR